MEDKGYKLGKNKSFRACINKFFHHKERHMALVAQRHFAISILGDFQDHIR